MLKKRGITLVALVITIIVLLILAGITISLTIGQNGIITRAQEAGKNYTQAQNAELTGLNQFDQDLAMMLSNKVDGSWSNKNKVNSPKLANTGLTPITIQNDGSSNNADIEQEDWYRYDGTENRWANAQTADGSMFVWIPRFAYKINSDKSIDVVFLKNTTNLYEENGIEKDATRNGYIIHPAFQDGTKNYYANGEWDKEITGFWMAKFEAAYDGEAQNADSAKDSNVSYSTIHSWNGTEELNQENYYYGKRVIGTIIKYPIYQANRPSMNYISIGDSFSLVQDMTSQGNPYGLRNMDSHMPKNSEWGAVAYLTQSKYGRNGTEVTINNVSLNEVNYVDAVTGFGASSVSAGTQVTSWDKIEKGTQAGSWTTYQGQLASTTGNIYGIYDLSGGVWERTAGFISVTTGNYATFGGALKGESDKYRSKYAGSSATDTENYSANPNPSRVGEAIWETSISGTGSNSWNNDYSIFSYSGRPFFVRGGSWGDGTSIGLFAFNRTVGYGTCHCGFRAVLIAE